MKPLSLSIYHEKVIRPGFSATGSNKWQAHKNANGKIDTKESIFQLQGINSALAMKIMNPIVLSEMRMLHLKVFATLGISMKKLENSTSLAVAPHDMSMLNIWQRSACETCKDMPPKKTTNMKHQEKFSNTVVSVSSADSRRVGDETYMS